MNIQTYLINLDSSTERLQQADEQLKKFAIPYQRISAVDGRQLDLTKFSQYDSTQAWQQMGRDLLGAEIGCYLSHIKCIEQFLQSDADYAIVLEDDLNIKNNFLPIISESLHWLEQQNIEWYLMNIGSHKRKFSKKLHTFQQYQLVKAYYFPISTFGLIWSRQGAEAFFNSKYNTTITMPIDVTLQFWLCRESKGLTFIPSLINHCDDIESNINHSQQTRKISNLIPRQKRMWFNKIMALYNMLRKY